MINRFRSLGVWSLALFLLGSAAGASEVYKYEDPEGTPVYTDRPQDVEAEQLAVQSQPTESIRIDIQDKRRAETVEKRDIARADRKERAAAEKQAEEKLIENCVIAQQQLEKFLTAQRLYDPLPDGGRRWYTDEEQEQAIAKARQDVAQWCG